MLSMPWRHGSFSILVVLYASSAVAAGQSPPEQAAATSTAIALPETSGSRLAPNRLSVAVGAVVATDYEGSNDYAIVPAAGATARFMGHNMSWRGNGIAVDLVPEYRDQKFKVIVAPFASLNLDRASTPRDTVVKLIRKRKIALEAGAVLGVTESGVLTSKYDSLTMQVSASHDVGSVHKSFIVTPTVEYIMPVSKAALLAASLSADVVGGRYARYYFGVGPNASMATGLPIYRLSGGLKSITTGLAGVVSLRGDLRKGFAVGVLLNYERLLGDFAASPLLKTRGNANQFTGTVGVAYTF